MDRVVRVFSSHAEADAADREEVAALSPRARLDRLLDMMKRYREGLGETADRFERVCRVTSLSRR